MFKRLNMSYNIQNIRWHVAPLRSNRKGMPPNLMKDSAIARGEYDYRFSTSGIGVFKWRDNKTVPLPHLTITETKLQVF
ncbi:hypothetical protein QTP88_010600 [Uroleucon formosanum]